jgi:polysaccharide biosynthesis/export protein
MSGDAQKQKWIFLLSMALVFVGSSCVSHRDLISLNGADFYFSPKEAMPDSMAQVVPTPAFQPYKIRTHDQLLIQFNSFEGSTGDFINQNQGNQSGANRFQYDPPTVYFNSYSVSDSGFIKLPILEEVPVVGLTTTEIQNLLDEKLKPYLRLAATNVKLGNRRVTLMGEVQRPGVQYLYNEKNTLLEAISLAGDFTPFSDRRKVKVIRQTDTGVKSVYLNLNRSDFLATSFYYVQPNDVIYVQPLKAKSFDVSSRSIGVVISGISLAAVIVSIIVRR